MTCFQIRVHRVSQYGLETSIIWHSAPRVAVKPVESVVALFATGTLGTAVQLVKLRFRH